MSVLGLVLAASIGTNLGLVAGVWVLVGERDKYRAKALGEQNQ